MMLEKRFDVINHIAKTYYNNECSYLEIGVEYPDQCFNLINAKKKTSVDPARIEEHTRIDYLMTSDNFFSQLEAGNTEFKPDFKWDIIFIDGLHLAEQVYRDIQNALRHCSGFILLHDCAPPNFWNAHSDYEYFMNNRHEWNGSTWKAFYKYRTETDRKTYTVYTDYGIGVIEANKPGFPISFDNKWFEYGMFKMNMKHDLGIVSQEEFVRMHSKEISGEAIKKNWWEIS